MLLVQDCVQSCGLPMCHVFSRCFLFRIASNRVGCRCFMCFQDVSCSGLCPIVSVADVSCVFKILLVHDCVQSCGFPMCDVFSRCFLFRIAPNRVGCRCVMCFQDASCSGLIPIVWLADVSCVFKMLLVHDCVQSYGLRCFMCFQDDSCSGLRPLVWVADVSCVLKMLLVHDCVQSCGLPMFHVFSR